MSDNKILSSSIPIKNEIISKPYKRKRRNATCERLEYEKDTDTCLYKDIKKIKIEEEKDEQSDDFEYIDRHTYKINGEIFVMNTIKNLN